MAKISFAIITTSDTRDIGQDEAGAALEGLIADSGWETVSHVVVHDDINEIREELYLAADKNKADIILTCGGTGLGPRDNTPEATIDACSKMVPGIADAIRERSLALTGRAMLSRAVAGMRGRSLIINLPGSTKGATEAYSFVCDQFEHAVDMMAGGGH